MDATAIKEIRQSQDIISANNTIHQHIHDNVITLPKDFEIHNLEKYFDGRTRFRGKMETKDLPSFTAYALTNSQEGSTAFIDADTMKAKIFINLGNEESAGHADHTAQLALEKTAPLLALLAITNERKSQKEVAEFIEDWRSHLSASRAENEAGEFPTVSIVKAIHAVRKISIEALAKQESQVTNFGAATTSMESIDVKSDEMPPDYFYFQCEPYSGLPARIFTLRLSVITDRAPALVLRIVKFEEHKEQMAREFQEIIEQNLEGAATTIQTFVGTFAP